MELDIPADLPSDVLEGLAYSLLKECFNQEIITEEPEPDFLEPTDI